MTCWSHRLCCSAPIGGRRWSGTSSSGVLARIRQAEGRPGNPAPSSAGDELQPQVPGSHGGGLDDEVAVLVSSRADDERPGPG